tara:strand:+ start:55616 stop:56659 length:1044 start_codon:yes stop_codon:yes gene_type:complete
LTIHTVTIQPSGTVIHCRSDQTIAEAAEEQGVAIAIGCDNGVCEICRGEYLDGEFDFRNSLGEQRLKQDNQLLCCVAQPRTDAEIFMSDVHAPHHKPEMAMACQISAVEPLKGNVYRVTLLTPAGQPADFWPGQYLMLTVPAEQGEQQLPYSIASAPGALTGEDARRIELHIAAGSETSDRVMAFLKQSPTVRVTLPFGDCRVHPQFLADHAEPLIMIAAGTGFSQIKSLVEGILAMEPEREMHIYWSNRGQDGFYLADLPISWAQQYANLHYHPIIEQHSDGWHGRAGWIYQVIHEDFTDLSNVRMFACGSPNMVYGTLDQLEPLGLSINMMHSDVFAYAPRPDKA